MNVISFNTANFVAREIGYHMPGGWGDGDRAATDWFSPIETFPARFDTMIGEVAALGFSAVDIWSAQLNYTWATPEHITAAKAALSARGMRVVSYAGGLGGTLDDARSACELCASLGVNIIGGGSNPLKTNYKGTVDILRETGIKFGYENHPEKTVDEILEKIGAADADVLGLAVDTGWLGTNNMDAPSTLRALSSRLFHLHLKDVKARRTAPTGFGLIDIGHETCELGSGIVQIEQCVSVLKEVGYAGAISIEHEPEDFDPRADVEASRKKLENWLRSA